MSEIKLKPCPFCGGEAKFENMGEFVVTKCEDCGAESDMIRISAEYCANEKAAEKWNQRINQPPKANWKREDCTSFWDCDVKIIKNGAATCSRCKKSFLCRRIILIIVRTAGQEPCKITESDSTEMLKNILLE